MSIPSVPSALFHSLTNSTPIHTDSSTPLFTAPSVSKRELSKGEASSNLSKAVSNSSTSDNTPNSFSATFFGPSHTLSFGATTTSNPEPAGNSSVPSVTGVLQKAISQQQVPLNSSSSSNYTASSPVFVPLNTSSSSASRLASVTSRGKACFSLAEYCRECDVTS